MNLARTVDCIHAIIPGNPSSQAYSKGELQLPEIFSKNQGRTLASENITLFNTKPNASLSPKFPCFICFHHSYSPSLRDKRGRDGNTNFPFDKIKDVWKNAVEKVTHCAEKVEEASDEFSLYVQQFLDSHPYLYNMVIPVGGTLAAAIIAWIVMPRILRKLHRYSKRSPAAILLEGSISGERVPYEKSFWGALEDPVRYLVTFMAFWQICVMVAPTTLASHLGQAWRGAVILSFVWFLHQWKTNTLGHIASGQSFLGLGQDKLLALDKVSSVGLFVIGIMALAEACGVAVQSIVTVGGIGGVATAFATRDILGNVFSGLSMQFSEPFTVGDKIKAGTVEGEVVEMGLTTTSLLNADKFPVVVPNSLFSSQVIVNMSRAEYCAITSKIPLGIGDFSIIPRISDDIKSMLKTKEVVFLGKEAPYCYLSRIECSFAQLTIGYNIKYMR
ncbi:mechanosensitive ion channel protein 1, mitochondrial-like [Neltuma alba]|uniref:mechanosensitive ion channel protein 1, mitochondrial-like n=1 Tax=Neltuma alba TaxID=207710 RepID=UPI0010A3C3FE|nr:mechanosensitive ion channel protein 1, mitochondrial-like [Prosopis alba]